MVPSSRQWMSIPSADVLVYPTLLYAITPPIAVNKSLAKSRRSRSLQNDVVKSAMTTGGRSHSVVVRRRHSDGTPSQRRHSDGTPSQRRVTTTVPVRSRSPSPLRRNIRRRRRHRGNRPYGGTTTAARGSRAKSLQSQRWRREQERWPRSIVRRGRCGNGAPREPSTATAAVDERKMAKNVEEERDAARISASVVLLAHGNRSLHVLIVQRCQSFVTSTPHARRGIHNSTSSSTVVTRYKLPGGQVMLTDNEKDKYKLEDRNTCSCPDDPRWYTAALKHFMVQHSQQTDVSPPAASSPELLSDHSDNHQLPFVLLGKWYRTQNKDDRERMTIDDDHDNGNGIRFHKNVSQCYYYPYRPAHISRQTVEHKRVYVIRDAVRLFHGPTPFRLRVPRAKTKTVAGPDGAISVIKTTTYKYKFIPLARLHENTRLYGPILSSLPVVLSSMNLVYLP